MKRVAKIPMGAFFMSKKFSFIIPSYNEEKYIEGCLKSIKSQTTKNYEIILVDSYSKDKTTKIAKKYGCKIFYAPKNGPGFARNVGSEKAKGDILIFSDSDTRFERDFLEKLEKTFKENIGGGICNLFVFDPKSGKDIVSYKTANYLVRLLIKMGLVITSGSCFIYRKEVFEKIGGFNSEFMTNEDHDVAKKVSKIMKFQFFDDINVYTSCRRIHNTGFWRILAFYFRSTLKFYVKNSYLKNNVYWS